MLALTTALSATLTAQIGCDPAGSKDAGDNPENNDENEDEAGSKSGSPVPDEYELEVTKKSLSSCFACLDNFSSCCAKFQAKLEKFVDHDVFGKFILFCILTNTFCMGIEFHNQVITYFTYTYEHMYSYE